MKIKVGIVDDHQLFVKSLSLMLASFNHYEVVLEATNGKDLQQKIVYLKDLPDLMLVDVNMPVMNGIETAGWLNTHYPQIKLIALSMNDGDKTILSMLRAGCCAYLLKDLHPTELETALNDIYKKGYYNADATNANFRRLLINDAGQVKITEKEKHFLQLSCSDLTYKQIAKELNLSERTVDSYREIMFEKLNVQSRVGMVLEAIRMDLVKI